MRDHRALVSLAGTALLLAACGGIPASSTPEAAEVPVDLQQAARSVSGDRPPPEEGASQREIVVGFLSAMEQYSSHEIAREYLTRDADAEWVPLSEILVFTGQPKVDPPEGDVAKVELMVEATFDRVEGFVRHPAGTTETITLGMEQVDGEWRLADAPDGLLISSSRFDQEFGPYHVYFYDKSFEVLVPDTVYLPVTAANQEVLLVEALLAGPSQWLAPAVETAIPEGTTVHSVPQGDGRPVSGSREVKLSSEAIESPDGTATSETRNQMVEQIVQTVGGLDAVDEVAVTVGATPLSGTDDNPFVAVDRASTAAERLYGIAESGVVTDVGSTELTPINGPLGSRPELREIAIDQHHGQIVAITEDNGIVVASLRPNEPEVRPLLADVVADFDSPMWDREGLLWAIEGPRGAGESVESGEADTDATEAPAGDAEVGDASRRLLVIDPATGRNHGVTVDSASSGEIAEFAIARDGVRIALVIDGEVYLGVIVRDRERLMDPETVRVERVRHLNFDFLSGSVMDLDWYAIDRLALLVQPDADVSEEVVPAGETPAPQLPSPKAHNGSLVDLRAPENQVIEGARSIDASAIDGRWAVGTDDGSVSLRSTTGRWERSATETLFAPAFAG